MLPVSIKSGSPEQAWDISTSMSWHSEDFLAQTRKLSEEVLVLCLL
jgi:hypothetical protein